MAIWTARISHFDWFKIENRLELKHFRRRKLLFNRILNSYIIRCWLLMLLALVPTHVDYIRKCFLSYLTCALWFKRFIIILLSCYVWFICEVNDEFGDVKVHMMYKQLWLTFSVNDCVIICNKFGRNYASKNFEVI